MRGKHSEAIQKLKSQFLREKRSYQKESDEKIQEMAQQASHVCTGSIIILSVFICLFFFFSFTLAYYISKRISVCFVQEGVSVGF